MTTIKQELADKTHNYKPLLIIKSKASTLKGINNAIKRETMEDEECFSDEATLKQAEREGFISFHKDGFIIWYDGV